MRQRFDHDGSQNRKHNSENNKYFILNRLAQTQSWQSWQSVRSATAKKIKNKIKILGLKGASFEPLEPPPPPPSYGPEDNVWSSCLNFPITLDCEIPQYLEVFTFHHSLRLLFIPAISSFQSTFTTKLPVNNPHHVVVSSPFIFCLRQITALTHHMGHRFTLTSAHSAQTWFCCEINNEISYNFLLLLLILLLSSLLIGIDKKQQHYIIKKKINLSIRETNFIFCCRNTSWDSPDLMITQFQVASW